MSRLDGKYLIKILSNWVGDSVFHVNGQQGKWEEKPKVDWVTTKPVHARWDFTVQEIDRPFPYNNNHKRHMVVEAHLDDWMWLIRTTFYARSGGGGWV